MDNTYKIPKKESKSIMLLSFIMSLMIVVRHSTIVDNGEMVISNRGGVISEIEKIFFAGFSNLCVPMFFVISGFLFFCTCKWDNLFSKILKRIKSLGAPYILWNSLAFLFFASICLIPFVSASLGGTIFDFTFKDYINNLITPSVLPLWYVKHLIIIAVLTPLMKLTFCNKWVSLAVLTALLALTAFLPYKTNAFLYSVSYFYFGAVASVYFPKRIEKNFSLKLTIPIFLLLSAIAYVGCCFIRLPILAKNIVFVLQGITLYHIVKKIKISDDKIKNSTLIKSGFFVYCGHTFFVPIVRKLMFMALGTSEVSHLINWVAVSAVSIFGTYLILLIIKKICPPLASWLSGGRS